MILSYSFSCSYDYLQLFDGDSTNDNSLGKFCGNVFAPISSRHRFLTLNFVTDGSHGFRGFELFYNFTDHVMRKTERFPLTLQNNSLGNVPLFYFFVNFFFNNSSHVKLALGSSMKGICKITSLNTSLIC